MVNNKEASICYLFRLYWMQNFKTYPEAKNIQNVNYQRINNSFPNRKPRGELSKIKI
jgi:hypothetical protein